MTDRTGEVPRMGRPAGVHQGALAALRTRAPAGVYLVAALATLGLAAVHSARDMQLAEINRDIWQHVAALRALMSDLGNPANPFVAGDDTSRHFHPLWVAMAWIGRAFDLSVWQVLTLASGLSMTLLAAGIFAFARVFYTSPWGPTVLLATMMAGWAIQPHHTGFHSFHTLLFAAAYPATFVIGCSLVLWALVIRSLDRWPWGLALVPLTATMAATHQLGAVIGLIGAGCFVLFWPAGRPMARIGAALALTGGLALSLLWPYANPVELVLRPGHSDWAGGPDFYNPAYLSLFTLPVAVGVLGLRDARGRAVLAALAAFGCAYLIGLTGAQVAGRFLMPIVLCLHIGLAALLLGLLRHPRLAAIPRPAQAAAAILIGALWLGLSLRSYDARDGTPPDPAPYAAALALAADIPDDEEIAALALTAWPIVGTGQRVHSIPWPEPGIPDLARRQAATAALFDPALPPGARRAQAQALGIRTLIADRRITPPETLAALSRDAAQVVSVGTLTRFDLAD